jgi:hypothetical protein
MKQYKPVEMADFRDGRPSSFISPSLLVHSPQIPQAPAAPSTTSLSMKFEDVKKAASIGMATIVAAGALAQPAQAITKSELNQLSYLQVKGTGLANRCPEVIGEGSITPKTGQKLVDMCIEPKAWAVEEEVGSKGATEKRFVTSKVMTRQTYTLDGIEGNIAGGNPIVFSEKEVRKSWGLGSDELYIVYHLCGSVVRLSPTPHLSPNPTSLLAGHRLRRHHRAAPRR